MRYFKNSKAEVFGYAEDQQHLIDDLDKTWTEITGCCPPAPVAPTPREEALSKIAELESTITPRRLREAVLGTDNGWLAGVEGQLKKLRAAL